MSRPRPTHAASTSVVAARALALLLVCLGAAGARADGDAVRGRAVFESAGGCSCHTNLGENGEGDAAPWLAGGRAIATPFGTYYSTNITPDDATGLGAMAEADFLRAMQEGRAPDGSRYFPVFPYTSFTRMTDADLRDLYAFLRTVPAVQRENRAHEAAPPFRWRIAALAWQWLAFEPARFAPDASRDEAWNRGAYLVTGPGHCGECHSPRNLIGAVDASRALAGSVDGPEGESAPNLTPDDESGLGEWSDVDLVWYLETGILPDGDAAEGLMAELIEHGFAKLPESDRRAIAVYLRSLAPIASSLPHAH